VVALTVAGLLLGQRSRQERPARLHRELVSSLRGAGAPEVAVTVTPELTVILQGTVRSEEERRRLDRLVEGEGARKVVNAVQVFRREAMVEKVLNDRLKSAGLDGVHADVDESMTARLTGRVTRSEEVERALQLTRSDPEVSRVVNEVTLEPLTKPAGPGPPSPPPFDPVRFEGIINRQLRQAGFNGLSVAVGEDLAVAVKGSVESRDAKQRALDLVGAQAGGRKVKDLIFVVEP
jgi:osmotically-inducible protein OsmY